jgi:stearoyl-CoA desaturase (delta-9 desaturase)
LKPSVSSAATPARQDIVYPLAIPFVLVHLSCLAAIWSGVTWRAAAICVVLYWVRMFAIGAGYHRYFSHRAYSTSRVFQFVLAFLAQSSAQSSVLWWAAKHRHHHRFSDTEHDTHSPLQRGFLYSHVGWIFDRRHRDTDVVQVEDLARYPELRLLHRYELAPAVIVGAGCFLLAGWPGLIVGFLWSTVLLYHSTFCINSLAHMHGKARYVTGDGSRNNWLLALVTMGEGWHNNHHAYQSSARQGFRWWEVDPTYYILKGLAALRIVWDLKAPPMPVLRNEQQLGGRVINRAAEQLVRRFNPDLIAGAIMTTVPDFKLAALRETLDRAHHRAIDELKLLHVPEMPSREVLLERARAMFAKTISLDEIVDRAYEQLLVLVGARLMLLGGQESA